MHTHYLRSFLYTALGLVLSLLIYLIILPFVIVRKIVKWFKKSLINMMQLTHQN